MSYALLLSVFPIVVVICEIMLWAPLKMIVFASQIAVDRGTRVHTPVHEDSEVLI